MKANPTSIQAYNSQTRATDYHQKSGFDPERKARMLEATVGMLLELTPQGGNLLELGAGTGLLPRLILATNHFEQITVTDGAAAMLDLAKAQLQSETTKLQFQLLDFSEAGWSLNLSKSFSAVTSSMAIHHAAHKYQLFEEVYRILKPNGTFVFADHIAGETNTINEMIGHERGRIKLTAQGQDPLNPDLIQAFLKTDAEKQAAEGNQCESMSSYLKYLSEAGFQNVDCLWRDYWLAIFVAQKGAPESTN